MALAQQEMVGHAGNVVAYHDMRRFFFCQPRVVFRHSLGMFQEEPEQLVKCRNGAAAVVCDCGVRIEARKKKALQVSILLVNLRRERGDAFRHSSYLFHGFRAARFQLCARIFDKIRCEPVEYAF